jgi:hypothetical protein
LEKDLVLKSEENLVTTSEYVRRVAPKEWEEFLHAFDHYVAFFVNQLVTSPPDRLAQNQGRVQALAKLRETLMDAPKQMEKIEAQKAGKL